MQIQISWLLQKPTDLALHCLQRQSISGFSRTRLRIVFVQRHIHPYGSLYVFSQRKWTEELVKDRKERTNRGRRKNERQYRKQRNTNLPPSPTCCSFHRLALWLNTSADDILKFVLIFPENKF